MKVVVSYTKVVEETIEVDDKFYKLTDSGGYDDLSYDERESLESGLMEEIVNQTDAYFHDIRQVVSSDDEMMLEN
jgi:hypothetical protein